MRAKAKNANLEYPKGGKLYDWVNKCAGLDYIYTFMHWYFVGFGNIFHRKLKEIT